MDLFPVEEKPWTALAESKALTRDALPDTNASTKMALPVVVVVVVVAR